MTTERSAEETAIRAAVEKHCHCDTRWPATARIDDNNMQAFVTDLRAATEANMDWQPIETAPKDCEIEVRGDNGPYGVTSWTGRAKWGTPVNWHRDSSTWLSPAGAVLSLAGYVPAEWRPAS